MSEKLKKGQTAPLETDIRKISINLIDGFPNHPFYGAGRRVAPPLCFKNENLHVKNRETVASS